MSVNGRIDDESVGLLAVVLSLTKHKSALYVCEDTPPRVFGTSVNVFNYANAIARGCSLETMALNDVWIEFFCARRRA